jgi:trans-aconitate methyltransferase
MATKTQAAIQYWNSMRLQEGFCCANVSLFRLLGHAGVSLTNKKVLEVGFGANRGEDLLECRTRGAEVWGVDINQSYLDDFHSSNPLIPVKLMNAGTDSFPFEVRFDLIFHRDVIYYLSDTQIEFHFQQAHANLNDDGHLAFQFIENDLTIDAERCKQDSRKINFETLKNASTDKMFRGEINPLRTLDIDWLIATAERVGFKLKATKTHIESYTLDESVFRIDRYLLLSK